MDLGGGVDVCERRARLHGGETPARIDDHVRHPRHVNHNAAIAHRVSGDVVSAAPYGQIQIVLSGVCNDVRDISRSRTPDDRGRPPIDHRIPHLTGGVVRRVAGDDDLSLN
jgi:hypothetical protein